MAKPCEDTCAIGNHHRAARKLTTLETNEPFQRWLTPTFNAIIIKSNFSAPPHSHSRWDPVEEMYPESVRVSPFSSCWGDLFNGPLALDQPSLLPL